MKIRKRYLIPVLLLLVFVLGPRQKYPAFNADMTELDVALGDIETYIKEKEEKVEKLKKDNEARVIWADSVRQTEYSLVYLHGFSASPKEGDPIHYEFAKRYGMNLYLARLEGHGIDDKESFATTSPADWVASAKEAIAIGKKLGEKVILMSCSTGGTLSIYLAAHHPEDVHAQFLYSPNIDLYDGKSRILTMPWGLPLLRKMSGGNYRTIPKLPENSKNYWTETYRIEGLIAVRDLVNKTMNTNVFSKLTAPFFVAYHYKNEEECDKIISTKAIKEFYQQAGTPEDKKELVEFEKGSHVLISKLRRNDLELVRRETFEFAEQVLGLEVMED